MIIKDNGGSMKNLTDQVAAIRSRLISELEANTAELYEDENSFPPDMAGAVQYWQELSLNDLKDEHRRVKVRVEVYRAAKSVLK